MRTFAYVVDGKILEYPVYEEHIINRFHPIELYTPVVEGFKKELPAYSRYKEILTYANNQVTVNYEIIPYTLQELLYVANNNYNLADGPMGVTVKASQLDKALLLALITTAKEYGQAKLDEFAKTSPYMFNSADTCISYANSTIPEWKDAALRMIEIRDRLWSALNKELQAYLSDEKPIPTSIDQIAAILPAFVWDDEHTENTSTNIVLELTKPAVDPAAMLSVEVQNAVLAANPPSDTVMTGEIPPVPVEVPVDPAPVPVEETPVEVTPESAEPVISPAGVNTPADSTADAPVAGE